MNNTIKIPVDINISDEDIKRLEKVKQLLQDIKEIDSKFKLSNIINVNEDSVLIVTTDVLYCKKDIESIENDLKNRIGIKCVLIPVETKIDKAINYKIDYSKVRDYTTVTYYNEKGNPIKEETTQYR